MRIHYRLATVAKKRTLSLFDRSRLAPGFRLMFSAHVRVHAALSSKGSVQGLKLKYK